jgi:hypothetical protein
LFALLRLLPGFDPHIHLGIGILHRWRSRRIDHRARFRLTTSTDSEPSPRARLDDGDPGQSIFGYLVKCRRAPTTCDLSVSAEYGDG